MAAAKKTVVRSSGKEEVVDASSTFDVGGEIEGLKDRVARFVNRKDTPADYAMLAFRQAFDLTGPTDVARKAADDATLKAQQADGLTRLLVSWAVGSATVKGDRIGKGLAFDLQGDMAAVAGVSAGRISQLAGEAREKNLRRATKATLKAAVDEKGLEVASTTLDRIVGGMDKKTMKADVADVVKQVEETGKIPVPKPRTMDVDALQSAIDRASDILNGSGIVTADMRDGLRRQALALSVLADAATSHATPSKS